MAKSTSDGNGTDPKNAIHLTLQGKGGVGKSLVAANVGIFLATLGKRVILVDAAFGKAAY